MKKALCLYLAVFSLSLCACGPGLQDSPPPAPSADIRPSLLPEAGPTPKTALTPAPTLTAFPAPSPTTTPTARSTSPARLPEPIVYYCFEDLKGKHAPWGSVEILPDILVLGKTLASQVRGADPATNISLALQAMIDDPRNAWSSEGLEISRVTVNQGEAGVELQGRLFGAGDIVMIAARMQILLTVFAEPAVQSAVIILDGKNIANLGISRESQVRPEDYAFTREEIEAFLLENSSGR